MGLGQSGSRYRIGLDQEPAGQRLSLQVEGERIECVDIGETPAPVEYRLARAHLVGAAVRHELLISCQPASSPETRALAAAERRRRARVLDAQRWDGGSAADAAVETSETAGSGMRM